jgi:hypothetical protein
VRSLDSDPHRSAGGPAGHPWEAAVSDDNHDRPVDRALDLLLYAPLGLAALARDTVPGLVQGFAERGRAEIEHRRHTAEEKVTQARAVGRFAVDYGAPMVRKKVEERITDARGRAEQTFTGLVVRRDESFLDATDELDATAETAEAPTDLTDDAVLSLPVIADPVTAPAPSSRTNGSATAAADASPAGLPIPDYDELSASQVVSRLPGLGVDELEAIRSYETHGRGRRTILGKIDQLVR